MLPVTVCTSFPLMVTKATPMREHANCSVCMRSVSALSLRHDRTHLTPQHCRAAEPWSERVCRILFQGLACNNKFSAVSGRLQTSASSCV